MFLESVHQMHWPQATVEDLIDSSTESMLLHDPYENNCKNQHTFPKIEEEPEETPKCGYQNVNSEIYLNKGTM